MIQKQTKTVLLFATLLLANTITAQVTDFKLSDFKYRTPGFKALGFNTEAGADKNANKNSGFNVAPSLSYLHTFSNHNKQFSFSNHTSAYLVKSKANNNKSVSASFEHLFSVDEKIYKKDYFIGFGGEGNFSLRSNNEKKQNSSVKSVDATVKFKVNPYIGIGRGRLEDVSNAQMAVFILEDLYKAGKIKNKVSAENTLAFANLITQVYNRRVFDFRKRRMFEVEQIDSFLVANNILAVNDVRAINIISDNWSFALQPARTESNTLGISTFNYYRLQFFSSQDLVDTYFEEGILGQAPRLSGSQIYFRATPQLININNKIKDSVGTTKNVTNLKAIALSLTYNNYKPIKLKWGLHKYATVIYRTGTEINDLEYHFDNSSKEQTKGSTVEGNMGVALGYYPNSRTTLAASGEVGAFKNTGEFIINGQKLDENGLYLEINATTSYFINYNSRITGSFGFQVSKSRATPVSVVSGFNIKYNIYIF